MIFLLGTCVLDGASSTAYSTHEVGRDPGPVGARCCVRCVVTAPRAPQQHLSRPTQPNMAPRLGGHVLGPGARRRRGRRQRNGEVPFAIAARRPGRHLVLRRCKFKKISQLAYHSPSIGLLFDSVMRTARHLLTLSIDETSSTVIMEESGWRCRRHWWALALARSKP